MPKLSPAAQLANINAQIEALKKKREAMSEKIGYKAMLGK